MEVRVDTYVEDLEGMRRVINRCLCGDGGDRRGGTCSGSPGLIVESESEKAEWEAGQKRYALPQTETQKVLEEKDGSRIMKTITANIKEGIDQEIITEAGSILKTAVLWRFRRRRYTDLAAMHWMNRRRRKFTLRRKTFRQSSYRTYCRI